MHGITGCFVRKAVDSSQKKKIDAVMKGLLAGDKIVMMLSKEITSENKVETNRLQLAESVEYILYSGVFLQPE